MALQGAIERIQYHAAATAGVRAAPDNLDLKAANHGIFSWTYSSSGTMNIDGSGQGRDLHTITTKIFVTGSDLKNLSLKGEALIEDFVNRVRGDLTLNSTVDTIQTPLTYTVSPEETQEQTRIVYTFAITVKIRPTFTVI